jgi:hypothetical protein
MSEPYALLESLCLFLGCLFAALWYLTPPGHSYETVELERVSTRKVFLLLAATSFLAWLALRVYVV